jgi:hypothetical protein
VCDGATSDPRRAALSRHWLPPQSSAAGEALDDSITRPREKVKPLRIIPGRGCESCVSGACRSIPATGRAVAAIGARQSLSNSNNNHTVFLHSCAGSPLHRAMFWVLCSGCVRGVPNHRSWRKSNGQTQWDNPSEIRRWCCLAWLLFESSAAQRSAF